MGDIDKVWGVHCSATTPSQAPQYIVKGHDAPPEDSCPELREVEPKGLAGAHRVSDMGWE